MSLPSITPGTNPDNDRVSGVWIRTPYKEAFLTELKAHVPQLLRTWDPEEKAWWVVDEYADLVEHLLLQHWPDVMVYGEGGESDRIVSRDGTVSHQGSLFD